MLAGSTSFNQQAHRAYAGAVMQQIMSIYGLQPLIDVRKQLFIL